jgi:hypothetical protein
MGRSGKAGFAARLIGTGLAERSRRFRSGFARSVLAAGFLAEGRRSLVLVATDGAASSPRKLKPTIGLPSSNPVTDFGSLTGRFRAVFFAGAASAVASVPEESRLVLLFGFDSVETSRVSLTSPAAVLSSAVFRVRFLGLLSVFSSRMGAAAMASSFFFLGMDEILGGPLPHFKVVKTSFLRPGIGLE